jgi:hypothetical protein
MCKTIPLTRGYTALVDDSDYDHLIRWKWLYIGSGYAARFVILNGQKKLLYLHRYLLNAQADQRVDHISGDRLDNRRENLRLVTRSQNQQNRKCPTHTVSGKKGVTWHQKRSKWHVRISVNGTRIHLGYYDDVETAAQVYDAAARHFFNGYARPNNPNQPTPPEIGLRLAQILSKRAGRASGCGGDCALCTTCGDKPETS